MRTTLSARMHDHFADLTDPRRREVTYPLINMVVIATCAVIRGADDFVAIDAMGCQVDIALAYRTAGEDP